MEASVSPKNSTVSETWYDNDDDDDDDKKQKRFFFSI